MWLKEFVWTVRPVAENAGVKQQQTTWDSAKAALSAWVLPALGDRVMTSLTYRDC